VHFDVGENETGGSWVTNFSFPLTLRATDQQPLFPPSFFLFFVFVLSWIAGNGDIDWSQSGHHDPVSFDVPTLTLVNATTGHHLTSVVKDETYTIVVEGFEDKTVVNLVVVVENGLEFPLGIIPSFQGPSYVWQWRVSALLPERHYVTVKASTPFDSSKIAYTPRIMVQTTAHDASYDSFLKGLNLTPTQQQSVHPAIPAGLDRLRHLLSTTTIRATGAEGQRRQRRRGGM